MSLFTLFYNVLAWILYILAVPYIIFKSRTEKYKQALPSRFFLKNNPKFQHDGIWFHCCSFGETKAIKPILDELHEEVNLSVITNTGYEEAKKLSHNVRFLPFEVFLPFWTTSQKVLVVMEAELWYMLFLSAKMKKSKTILVNARISDKSYSSYVKFAWFYKKIFKNIDVVFAQSEVDKKRLEEIGAHDVRVSGNIKLSQLPKITKNYVKPKGFVTTAGSTHKAEEELILKSYDKNMGKLIIVPRHPERFDEVNELLKVFAVNKQLSYHRFSQKENFSSDIILLDKMGELNNVYAISDAVILGGAFEKIGGHNPVEPAYFNCRIISGKNYFNQKTLFECINDYYIVENDELNKILKNVQTLSKASLKEVGDIAPIIKEINGI